MNIGMRFAGYVQYQVSPQDRVYGSLYQGVQERINDMFVREGVKVQGEEKNVLDFGENLTLGVEIAKFLESRRVSYELRAGHDYEQEYQDHKRDMEANDTLKMSSDELRQRFPGGLGFMDGPGRTREQVWAAMAAGEE
jgi:hypothetical protein